MHISTFIQALEKEFIHHSNNELAKQQSKYLRNQFYFYGMTTPARRAIQHPFLVKEFLPSKKETFEIIQIMWNKPQREFQYFAQELAFKFIKQPDIEDIVLYEFMISNKSWWETVDFIAVKLVGNYFKAFPTKIDFYVEKWLLSNNIWLQRTALLFQLKYKSELNPVLLSSTIQSLLGSKEFFINKAIGWILREYSRTNPKWVITFVSKNALHPLSEREALRLLS